jgi:hypothetical protein
VTFWPIVVAAPLLVADNVRNAEKDPPVMIDVMMTGTLVPAIVVWFCAAFSVAVIGLPLPL